MEWLLNIDYSLLIFLNSLHSGFLDVLMMLFTAKYPWIPLYVAIAFYIFYNFGHKEGNYKYAFLLFVSALIIFAITDMGSTAIKHSTMRFRPGHHPALEGVIRLLDGKGGFYGFFSSHASNVFGLATFTSLAFKKRWYSITIFAWAFLVSYSRIYVGRHFPSDVICGMIFGFLVAYLIFSIIQLKIVRNLINK
ncbi:MAG: phosphatase PAP2 family protein [Bacteroidales bacterium]|nr:phosphatase PAP2 family protein [Bacteroidales bacterium]